jgi:hypothetical protein
LSHSGDGAVTTNFEQTPLMATYLIGFVLSDFEYVSNELTKQPGDTLHRIFVRSNAGKATNHALEINENVLKDLENYLDFEYELEKLDLVVVTGKDTREFNGNLTIMVIEISLLSQQLLFGESSLTRKICFYLKKILKIHRIIND